MLPSRQRPCKIFTNSNGVGARNSDEAK
ncbi:hypothetical protein CCACVL1_29370 [Corchorus capsularis]|uniref:Uncharacterized protein n=1 Tax=Corchorus capsularis TaxID=210143 RepID=A0A1R3G1W2_COCAP|nr:hypothetical protein CCACVL1_29370 [Corchorus capsularis]